MSIHITLNGQPREFAHESARSLADLLQELGFKSDRIAVEKNGSIVPRKTWPATSVADGDRLEVVHFVGGGAPSAIRLRSRSSQLSPY